MTYDSLVNRGDYFSAHYLAEKLPGDLKKKDGILARWAEQEKAEQPTPRSGLRALRKPYFKDRAYFAEFLENIREGAVSRDPDEWRKTLHELHGEVLRALGFTAGPRVLTVERSDKRYEIPVASAEPHDQPTVIAIECGWAPDVDAALDPEQAGLLLDPVELDNRDRLETGDKLAAWLFAGDEPPRYVLILAGGVIILADRATWGEGRYLAVSLDVALGRGNAMPGELDTIAALFGADSLLPPEEGGTEKLAELLTGSRQHAVGVSKDLRDGLRESVEIIANEVLDRIREQGFAPGQIDDPSALAKSLGRQTLRYLYRILFLLYAEARPELGVLPSDDEAYVKGYSMARIGDLVIRDLVSEESRRGFHLYESLALLFRMVNEGHNPRNGVTAESEGEGLRFEPLKADLFEPERTSLIGTIVLDEDDPNSPRIDTRLRNEALYKVMRLLMLAKGKRKERGGFISYAQLGINQLGAVYEGLMSYTGFIANEELYEVAKNGDPKDGSWMIPASKVDEYDDAVFVLRTDENGVKTDDRVSYKPGAFVYRLAGRDRQTSASYYTPESLTQVTVQLALRERLDQDGTTTQASEILNWTICEPALGSGAFLNEAINQVAAEYLRRRQSEVGEDIPAERYADELQKVKAYIALHNSYGVDLNETAVELAEVSLWLNVMHPGLQAPWFGLHLRRGNSLIGAGRRLYAPDKLKKKAWLTSAPDDRPFRDGPIPEGHIHHFLLPAQGWGAVAGEKEAKNLAPEEAKQLAAWRNAIRKGPSDKRKQGQKRTQVQRLQGLSRRAEYLWDLVIKRLELSEREISRQIAVWGAGELPKPKEQITREEILANLTAPGTPYWRLKTVMDAWCALWFWPLDKVALLDGSDAQYESPETKALNPQPPAVLTAPDPDPKGFPQTWEADSLFGESPKQLPISPQKPRTKPNPNPLRVERRPAVPLASFDDWLEFVEALLGTAEIPDDSLFPKFNYLADLDDHEDQLAAWMGMASEFTVEDRFPWLATVTDIADQQGFFHWELQFAQIFQRGGFDLQVGNPPWVRPRWQEDVVLAELEPWFMLAEKPSVGEWGQRKAEQLGSDVEASYFLFELAANAGISRFLSDVAVFPLLVSTQPDLYRAFMCRVWASLGKRGIAGLIHPGTHFGGIKESKLRGAAFGNLRFHAHFINGGNWAFPHPVGHTTSFGVHIYGQRREVEFLSINWLYGATVVLESLAHDGSGPRPGVKYRGKWDVRPHLDRLNTVTAEVLAEWRRLGGLTDIPIEETPLLYPITTAEAGAIEALSMYTRRVADYAPHISSGYHETTAKEDHLIRWMPSQLDDFSAVILQGPHFSQATAFAKKPSIPSKGSRDWSAWDLVGLDSDAVPATNYVRSAPEEAYLRAQDRWDGRNYTEYYRLAWRAMIPFDTERSLFAAIIPPGPAHVHTVQSMAFPDDLLTVMSAGFWAALPLDYLLRITGRSHLQVAEALRMPAPGRDHPLARALQVRTMRLNCLTSAYAPLWEKLFSLDWQQEHWAAEWPGLRSLGGVEADWSISTPLRTERERRAALVELDALVALWLGMSADQLVAIYASRYPVLGDYEARSWFDVQGRKIAGHHNAYGYGQARDGYSSLMEHLDAPDRVLPPEGYEAPFYKADREAEYRQAHAVFSERLRKAEEAGWSADGGGSG